MGKYYLIIDIEEDDQNKRCDQCIFNQHNLVGFACCQMLDTDYENTSAETVKECPLVAVEDVEALNNLLNPPMGMTLCDECEYLQLYEEMPGSWRKTCGNPDGTYHQSKYTGGWMPLQVKGLGCENGRKR